MGFPACAKHNGGGWGYKGQAQMRTDSEANKCKNVYKFQNVPSSGMTYKPFKCYQCRWYTQIHWYPLVYKRFCLFENLFPVGGLKFKAYFPPTSIAINVARFPSQHTKDQFNAYSNWNTIHLSCERSRKHYCSQRELWVILSPWKLELKGNQGGG